MGWVMVFHSMRDRIAALMLAASVALGFVAFASPHAAFAQAWPVQKDDQADDAATAKADETKADETKADETASEQKPDETTSDQKPTDTAEIDASTLDWSQLNVDASTLTYGPKAPPRR